MTGTNAPSPHDPHAAPDPTPFGADPATLRVPGDPTMGEVHERVRHADVTDEPVSTVQMAEAVTDARCGAVVTFDGRVRDHDDGRDVAGLEYSAHPDAPAIAVRVAHTIAERYPDALVAVTHRYGALAIGETALACAVAAPHRKLALAACDDLVDTIKRELPIWKHQRFADGTDEWVGALG